jgi:membrane protein YqaA with SNARE-associated domain
VTAMWILLAAFGLAVASAVVPWINGELVLLAFAARAASLVEVLSLVVAVTAGQVAGKSALYWVARRARHMPPAKLAATIARWRDRSKRRPLAALVTMFVSATVGVPPLYLTTLAAGALMVEFGSFLSVIICGRLLHFGAIALVPTLVGHLLQ